MIQDYMLDSHTIHGNLIHFQNHGCLLLGPSGSGKSLFAKHAIDAGGVLVADDIIQLFGDQDNLYGKAVKNGEGCIEIFGLGIVKLAEYLSESRIDCIFYYCPLKQTPRLYTAKKERLQGTDLSVFPLDYHHPSALMRLKAYLQYFNNDIEIL